MKRMVEGNEGSGWEKAFLFVESVSRHCEELTVSHSDRPSRPSQPPESIDKSAGG